MLNEALTLLKCGLQVLPAKPDKAPFGSWKELQGRLLTESEVKDRFAYFGKNAPVEVIGFLTGKVSGNVEVIDVDCKYDLTGKLYEELKRLIDDNLPEIADSLVIDKTRSGGYHIYYRCSEIAGNQKLARRPATPEEAQKGERVLDLVETRGEGGFIVTPPTKGYQLIQGAFETIPTITPDQRKVLLSIGRSFNLEPEKEPVQRTTYANGPQREGLSSFADYNQRGDLVSLLERHGWSTVFRQGEKIHLKRPGQSETKTSGNFHEGLRKLYVFSSSTEFEPEKAYSPSDAFILLECRSDKKEAYRRLLAEGYGTSGTLKERVTQVHTNSIKVEASDENGEGVDLSAESLLTEERIKAEQTMKAAYIYFTQQSSRYEVLESLLLLERTSPVKIYLVEVASLDDTTNPIQELRPSEYKAQDIINRYAETYTTNNGFVSLEAEDAFIEEFITIRQGLTDPFEVDRFRALWLKFSEENNLSITLDSIKAVEEKLTVNKERDEQNRDFTALIEKATEFQRTGNLDEALKELNEKSREISSKSKASTFGKLLEQPKESDIAERLKKKSDDLKTGYIIEDEELLLPVGALTVVAAPSSHGKTSFLLNTALKVAAELVDKSVYVFSYEEDADSVTISAMNAFIGEELSAHNRRTIRSYYKGQDYFLTGKKQVFEKGKERFFSELISTGRLNIHYVDYDSDTLVDAIDYLYKHGNAGAVFIDYMQMLHKGQRGKNKYGSRQMELQQICIDLKDVSVSSGLPIILGAQFNRDVNSYGMLHYTRIREAADIEHIANLILGFWNVNFKPGKKNDEDNDCLNYIHLNNHIYIEKLKHRTGVPGLAGMLSFDGNTGVISNYKVPVYETVEKF